MADRTFNDVKINLTLKPQAERANVSSSQEDLAVQMGKIQQWYPGLNNYATCATAADTAIKTVDCPGFELTTGTVVIVKFTVTNTAAVADLQLNVNETGAKGIKYRNANLSAASVLTANRIYAMLYDGTYWQIIGDLDTNSNTYDRTSVSTRIYAGAKGVFPYSLCAMDTVQRMQSFTTTGGTGTSKAFNSSEKFLYPPVIMYHSSSSTIANGSVIANNALYEQYPSVNMQYNANVTTTSAYSQYTPLYIECTFDSNGYWSPTGITQTFTSGKYYILLGCMYNTSIYQLALFAQHPLYYYDGTNLIDGESHLQDGRYIPMTGSYDISGNLGFNGTNHGYYLKDSTGLAFPGIYYNSTDFWIGATQQTTTHFIGRTMISTGYNSESGKGNTSIWVYIPNSTNTGSFGYEVFNSTNLVTGAGITISTANHQLYNGAVYTIKHSNSVTARTDYMQPYVKYDAQGHITGSSYWMATARGTGGVAGWVKVATIKHKMHYDDTPFLLDISQRGNTISYRIHIRWNSVDNVDPSLGEFLIASDHAWESIRPRAYIIKSATSTWDLYILKLDNYEAIAMRLQPGRYFDNHTEWTWKDEQTAESAITGGTEATKKIYSTTDHTHNSLTSKILAEWDLDNTDGNFFFKGDGIFGGNNDEYVGIQADSGNYKFQLLRYGDKLLFRPNNADGSTNWHEWNCLMTPYNVTAEDGITATYYASNIVSDNPETAFWHSVTLKHSNSVTAVTTASLLKFKYDAQGHITGSSAVVKGDIPTLDYVPFKTVTTAGSDMNDYMNEDGWIKWNISSGTNVPTSNWGILLTKTLPNIQVFIPDNATGIYFRRKANATSNPTEWWGLTGSAGNTYNLNNLPGKYAFIVDETSDFASYAWHKFAEVTVTGNRADATITFLVSKTWTYTKGNPSREVGILNAHIRTSSTNVFETGDFRWIVAGDCIDPTEFVMVYIDTASTSCKVELWHKQKSRWDGWVFKVLKEHSRLAYGENPWTLFVHTGHGSATYTDGTGNIVSTIITIANTSASADKINTDAGDSMRPVYFSGGIPVQVAVPSPGAWFSAVPRVNSSGVMEIGRYIDFHATNNESANDYDIRVTASSINTLEMTSKSSAEGGSTYFKIVGTTPMLRFQQTTSGKAYDNVSCGIWCRPASTNGVNMYMQSGGNIMIGAGEFASNAYSRKDSTGTTQVGYDNIFDSATEKLYLGADEEVQIISNGQNIATYSNTSHRVWRFRTNGQLLTPGAITDSLDNQHPMIEQNLKSASNCVALTHWIVDGAASATTLPGIYYHNTGGDSTDKGAIILQPYHSSDNPCDSVHPIGLYIGKGILQLDGVDVSLSTHTHDSLKSKALTKSTLDGTAGNFFFKGDNLFANVNDWVGIQADAGNDKFQLIAISAGLMYRQNDTGGTNSTNWTNWMGLLTPDKVTTDTYLSAEATTTTTAGSGDTAFIYNSGVKISHKAYTEHSSGLYKITVDAAGHVSAATALTITPTPSSKTHTNWNTTAERAYLVTKGWMSYWNGAYNSNNASNLTYCNIGAFGTIVTKSATDYVPNTTDGVNAAINLLNSGTSVPTNDDTCYISQDTNASNTGYYRRPIVKLWQYMVDRSIAFYYNGTADFADAPWAKVISMKCASASSYRHIALLVSKTHYNATDKYSWGILCIKFATNSSKNYDTASGVGTCDWLVAHGNIATTDFKITYTNTGTTSTTVDIWCKAGHRYASYVFKVLNDTMRGLYGAAYVGTSNIELFSVNGAGVAETSVTGTEITQTLTTIANTSAKANTVQGTLTNPTSETSYPIPFHATVSTGAKTLRNNNGLMHVTQEGTASALGYSVIRVGNNVASGTAGNKFGVVRIYSQNTSYVQLEAKSTTSAKTQWLSAMEGTLCCLNKNSTSYWGLYDGDASGTGWLRTTQSGFIPYASGAFTASTDTALGTDTWWFNRAYIRTIQTGVIKFRSGNTESNSTRSYLQLQQGLTGNYDWRLPPASGEVMIRKGSVTAGASQSILYSGTTSGWGHQSVEVFNIFKNWSLIVVNFMGGGYGYSSTDKHSFSSVVPLDFVKMKGTSPTEPYFIPVPANGTNVDATELIECIYVDDSTIEFNRSGASGGIGKITIWGIY